MDSDQKITLFFCPSPFRGSGCWCYRSAKNSFECRNTKGEETHQDWDINMLPYPCQWPNFKTNSQSVWLRKDALTSIHRYPAM